MSNQAQLKNLQNLENLENQLILLNQRLEKKTSFKYLFVFAIIQGIGYVIGATLIAGVAIAILARLLVTLDYVPFLNQIITSEQVQENFLDDRDTAR